MALWFNRVPQEKSVKHRVHLDIYTRSLADLEALGATVLPTAEGVKWTVMADPEGGEFCAFLRDALPERRLHGLVVDCADAPAHVALVVRRARRPLTSTRGSGAPSPTWRRCRR